ncbi:hypothetical protein ACFWZY_29175 [Streptomyces sp. NPDC058992]|uniref:hypothetical protein n=1 Tax=Streptomyces sp. NPDC058992 TaxID=3346688 RepID=UPI0036A2552F
MSSGAWTRPAAGREPAAAALLGWLADPGAPRLCVVSGDAGCGKSALLAWLVGHGIRPGTVPGRRVHGFVPLAGQSVRGTVWMLADQLGLAARAPGELLAALEADGRRTVVVLPDLHAAAEAEALAELILALVELEHMHVIVEVRSGHEAVRLLDASSPAVMNLSEAQWTDPERYEAWRTAQSAPSRPSDGAGPEELSSEPKALDDPAVICAADPVRVTTAFEASADEHGGLRSAWLRAGQALVRDQPPAERALVLLTALGDGADPRLRPALTELAAAAPWELLWSRIRGDVIPPWPGPVLAITTGTGPLDGQLLVADHQGVLRTTALVDATPTGRLPKPVPDAAAMCALPDGTLWVLDHAGQLHTCQLPAAGRPTGLAALLDSAPTASERAAETLMAQLARVPGSTLAASSQVVAVGDLDGAVHALALGEADTIPRTTPLHQGRVTAVCVVDIPVGQPEQTTPIVYSGGVDGRVRAWAPGKEPLSAPVAERPCAVTTVDCALTTSGVALAVAWKDGLIEHHTLSTGETRSFHPGQPVNAVALTPDEHLLIGTDEAVICLHPR